MAKAPGIVIGAVGCLGVLGLCVVGGFAALFYFGFVQRGGVYDDLRSRLDKDSLANLVPRIETYKIEYGNYPDKLQALLKNAPINSATMIYDASITGLNAHPRLFFYQRIGCDHYYLRAVGPDGLPFTRDDIVPDVDPATATKLGLLTAKQAVAEAPCVQQRPAGSH